MRARVASMIVAPLMVAPRLAPAAEERTWYGWETLLVDAAALGLVVSAPAIHGSAEEPPPEPPSTARGSAAPPPPASSTGSTQPSPLLFVQLGVGAAGFLTGAPVVHWARGNTQNGWTSFAYRGGTTLLSLGVVGCVGAHGSPGNASVCAVGILGLAGLVAAIPLDAAAIAWDPAPPRAAAEPVRPRLSLSPLVAAGAVRWGGAVTGTF